MKRLLANKAALIAITFALLTAAVLIAMTPPPKTASRFEAAVTKPVSADDPANVIDEATVPEHRQLSPKPSPPPPPPPPPSPKPKPKPVPKPVIVRNIDVYRGLGAWIDVYDSSLDATTSVAEMSRRGVKTLYIETSSWKFNADLQNQSMIDAYLNAAHAKGIKVVGWYLPGFADIDRDVRRSVFVLQYKSSTGHVFDGFAPDIEAQTELINQVRGEHADWSNDMIYDEARKRFNAAIVEYNKRLRASVAAGATIGAITLDAKNNERAPSKWAGYPWQDLAQQYDVIMPMAYWSASPTNKTDSGSCPGNDIDTFAYMSDVVSKTEALMGRKRPLHIIGGIADCISVIETNGYVRAMKALGAIGGGLYDFSTTQSNPNRDGLWAELAALN